MAVATRMAASLPHPGVQVQAVIDPEAPLCACASCGRRMARDYKKIPVDLLPDVFRLTREQLDQRDALGSIDLFCDEQAHQRIEDLTDHQVPLLSNEAKGKSHA